MIHDKGESRSVAVCLQTRRGCHGDRRSIATFYRCYVKYFQRRASVACLECVINYAE